ncbi:MAG TPA: hypothetical protein VFY90_08595 [Tepidiformaceae bacterium]|nr:hypothetical protein [Tepidiformaceae bacterium]
MSLTLAAAASVQAQSRQSGGTSARMEIRFGTQPHWVAVPGTRVRSVSQRDRTDYDIFRYDRYYYAYNHDNGRWYRSRNWRGQFSLIDDRNVPRDLRRVPRNRWRNYPSAWSDDRYQVSDRRQDQGRYQDQDRYQNQRGTSGVLRVSYGTAPRWMSVRGTRVEEIPMAQRTRYDVFRYGGSYYAYDNNRWYSSSRESGDFMAIDARSVPSELSRVPREHWRNYPTTWQDQGRGW